MDKDKVKEYMTLTIFNYFSEREVLSALISKDEEKMVKMKNICDTLSLMNKEMVLGFDAANEEECNKIVGSFKIPQLDLE